MSSVRKESASEYVCNCGNGSNNEKGYHNVTIMRLTLPHFSFCYWLASEIFPGFFCFRDRSLCREFQAGVVADAGARDILAINHPTAGIISIADRDAIVERHKESVGVSVKKVNAFGHVGMTTREAVKP
jgi:hypothetical protein